MNMRDIMNIVTENYEDEGMTSDEAKVYAQALKDAWLEDTRPDQQKKIAQKALDKYRAEKQKS